MAFGTRAAAGVDCRIFPADRRGCAAGALPGGVGSGRGEHVHCLLCCWPGGADRVQRGGRAQCRVCRGMGTAVQSRCIFPLRHGRRAELAAVRSVSMALCCLSLTLVRMLPVAVALMGTHLSRASVIFMGWFGPRGLASIVLAGLPGGGTASARRANDPNRGDRDGLPE